MTRRVEFEIQLIALANGHSICDVVETSNHHAPYFARHLMRDPEVTHIGACKPGTPLDSVKFRQIRETRP